MNQVRIAIAGASGRMGRMLVETTLKSSDLVLVAAFDQADSPSSARMPVKLVSAPCGVTDHQRCGGRSGKADCLIDFTRPEGTLHHLELARTAGCGMVIGTTGFSAEDKAAIAAAAEHIPVVFAPNMAVGMNAVFKLLDVAARILSEGYDVEIIEAHHRLKVDAPSGTALRMGEVVANALGRDLESCAVHGREG